MGLHTFASCCGGRAGRRSPQTVFSLLSRFLQQYRAHITTKECLRPSGVAWQPGPPEWPSYFSFSLQTASYIKIASREHPMSSTPPPTEAILIILTCHLWCSEPRVTFCFSTECHAGQSSTAWLCQARVAGCVFQGAAASSDYTASRLLWGTLRVWGGRTLEACLFAVCFSIF